MVPTTVVALISAHGFLVILIIVHVLADTHYMQQVILVLKTKPVMLIYTSLLKMERASMQTIAWVSAPTHLHNFL